ncbi:MAG: hypothetical protein RIF46_10385 [Cyclobacteriaceae bacterium]
MTPEISSALTLLAIGMITVFVVLLLVVITGNILIRLVNRFVPESKDGISDKTLAVLTAAVESVTGGKGKITKIEKQ